MAGGKCLLVEHRADVELFGHGNVFRVFDHGNRLGHAETFGGHAGQNVGFRIECRGHKHLSVLDVFVAQQVDVAPIAVEHQNV